MYCPKHRPEPGEEEGLPPRRRGARLPSRSSSRKTFAAKNLPRAFYQPPKPIFMLSFPKSRLSGPLGST